MEAEADLYAQFVEKFFASGSAHVPASWPEAVKKRCNFLVNIPTNPEYGSLNIAQAVQIMAYELRLAAIAAEGG